MLTKKTLENVLLAMFSCVVAGIWFEIGIKNFFLLPLQAIGYLALALFSYIFWQSWLWKYRVWEHRGEKLVLEEPSFDSTSNLHPCCQEATDWLESHKFRTVSLVGCYIVKSSDVVDVLTRLREETGCESLVVR